MIKSANSPPQCVMRAFAAFALPLGNLHKTVIFPRIVSGLNRFVKCKVFPFCGR